MLFLLYSSSSECFWNLLHIYPTINSSNKKYGEEKFFHDTSSSLTWHFVRQICSLHTPTIAEDTYIYRWMFLTCHFLVGMCGMETAKSNSKTNILSSYKLNSFNGLSTPFTQINNKHWLLNNFSSYFFVILIISDENDSRIYPLFLDCSSMFLFRSVGRIDGAMIWV